MPRTALPSDMVAALAAPRTLPSRQLRILLDAAATSQAAVTVADTERAAAEAKRMARLFVGPDASDELEAAVIVYARDLGDRLARLQALARGGARVSLGRGGALRWDFDPELSSSHEDATGSMRWRRGR